MSKTADQPIAESEVIPMLVAACPSFRTKYDLSVATWRAEFDEDPPHDTIANELASHLIERLEASDTSCFTAVFRDVDRILARGDVAAREIVVLSIIFELRETDNYSSGSADRMLTHLGPLARRAWTSGDEFLAPVKGLSFGEWSFVALFTAIVLSVALYLGCG